MTQDLTVAVFPGGTMKKGIEDALDALLKSYMATLIAAIDVSPNEQDRYCITYTLVRLTVTVPELPVRVLPVKLTVPDPDSVVLVDWLVNVKLMEPALETNPDVIVNVAGAPGPLVIWPPPEITPFVVMLKVTVPALPLLLSEKVPLQFP